MQHRLGRLLGATSIAAMAFAGTASPANAALPSGPPAASAYGILPDSQPEPPGGRPTVAECLAYGNIENWIILDEFDHDTEVNCGAVRHMRSSQHAPDEYTLETIRKTIGLGFNTRQPSKSNSNNWDYTVVFSYSGRVPDGHYRAHVIVNRYNGTVVTAYIDSNLWRAGAYGIGLGGSGGDGVARATPRI